MGPADHSGGVVSFPGLATGASNMFRRRPRSTPAGEHKPVLLEEVLGALKPTPGNIVVDCTLGYAGHSSELLRRIVPGGKLIAFDLDRDNIERATPRLTEISPDFVLHHGNFAGFWNALAADGLDGCDCLLADLGMSSMQVDDAERGFSFMRDGPLDMRMDRSRGRTAADLLLQLSAQDLASAFRELGDEPMAEEIAHAIVARRSTTPLSRTRELMELIMEAAPVRINPNPRPGEPSPRQQRIRPTARVFQALRILVNRELANLQELLRLLPTALRPGGRAAIISFHSGEDRLVKASFKEGERRGIFAEVGEGPVRAGYIERFDNPRARSAKLRWARRAVAEPEGQEA